MSDHNFKSYADVSDVVLKDEIIDPPDCGQGFDDILKLSHVENFKIDRLYVYGGCQDENAIDMNRECRKVSIAGGCVSSGKQNAITIKGGCSDIWIRDLVIIPGTGHCDIEIGNWSDQSQQPVRYVILENITRSDGRPVRLRLGHCEHVTVIGGKVEIQHFASFLLKRYVALKRFFRRGHIL